MECLLCRSIHVRERPLITGIELRRLHEAGGRHLSEIALSRIAPDAKVVLYECSSCGFQFFDPMLAGSGEFYAELEQKTYYPPYRPEFDFALRVCVKRKAFRVFDVGAGDGAFLDTARNAGLITAGSELNRQAAAVAASKGHLMFTKPLEAITAKDLDEPPDMVTLFQVLEHVPDPISFVLHAAAFAKPGGFLIISVPNRFGSCRLMPFDPANLPPHHITRWRLSDMVALACTCKLDFIESGFDKLTGGDFEKFVRLHNGMAPAIGRSPHPGGSWLPALLSFFYRKLGMRHFLPIRGASLYAVFQR